MGKRNNVAFTKETYQKRLSEVHEYLEITSNYVNSQTRIRFKCNKCGVGNQDANPHSLLSKDAVCIVCGNSRKALTGYTDICTTHPNHVAYFDNIEDAKRLKMGSLENVEMHCPICGHKRIRSPKKLFSKGFCCPKCSDNTSYPNRFMFNLLEQLGIDFDNEVKFGWSQNRRYDFIVGNTLIEMDGAFHNGSGLNTKEDAQRIDLLKDNLAKENGYDIIRIPCFESRFDLIKNSVLSSRLADISKLEDIDWVALEKELIINNMVKKASDVFNEYKGIKRMDEMAKILNIRGTKLCTLLKISARVGMTDYDEKLSSKGFYTPNKVSAMSKKAICLETGKVYNSCLEAEKEHGLRRDAVARICRGERLTTKGLHFDFVETTKEIQDNKIKMQKNCDKIARSSKRVYCEELDMTFGSGKEASLYLGMAEKYVSSIIRKNKKSRENYSFRYI